MTTRSSGQQRPAKLRLLLIDDDLGLRTSMARLLRRNFEVVAVESTGDALALLASGERFDALVTDLQMPDGDGFQAIARVAAFDMRLARRAVIWTGAHMADDDRAELADAGHVVIAKGSPTADLVDAIHRQLARYP